MQKLLKSFFKSEDGAVTVEWVVLTAVLLLMGILVVAEVEVGAGNLGGTISDDLEGN